MITLAIRLPPMTLFPPDVQKAAKKLMEDTKTQKILLDGRKLHFEYT